MNPEDLSQIGKLFASHSWALFSIAVLLWFYRALSDDSKFPLTWPEKWAKWKPVSVIVVGQLICVIKAIAVDHVRWYLAIKNGVVIAGLALGGIHILRLWWPKPGDEPKWLQALVLVFNKVAPILVTVSVAKEDDPGGEKFKEEIDQAIADDKEKS